MNIEEPLYQTAAMYTKNNQVLMSVSLDVLKALTELCMDTGSILEAHKLDTPVTHSICVVRENESAPF